MGSCTPQWQGVCCSLHLKRNVFGYPRTQQLTTHRIPEVSSAFGWHALWRLRKRMLLPCANRFDPVASVVNQPNAVGETALMLCCRAGRAGAARLLLEAGASPAVADGAGRTALHLAALAGSAECVELLLFHSSGRGLGCLAEAARDRQQLQPQPPVGRRRQPRRQRRGSRKAAKHMEEDLGGLDGPGSREGWQLQAAIAAAAPEMAPVAAGQPPDGCVEAESFEASSEAAGSARAPLAAPAPGHFAGGGALHSCSSAPQSSSGRESDSGSKGAPGARTMRASPAPLTGARRTADPHPGSQQPAGGPANVADARGRAPLHYAAWAGDACCGAALLAAGADLSPAAALDWWARCAARALVASIGAQAARAPSPPAGRTCHSLQSQVSWPSHWCSPRTR
jgi:hypothetical protein